MVTEESKLDIILYFHVFASDLFAVTQNPTSRADETTTEDNNSGNKPERPKPPTSLITNTLQATPATQIPIVSPDRSLHACNTYIHTHKYLHYLHTFIHLSPRHLQLIVLSVCAVHRQTETRTRIMILCPHRPPSRRARCCRSSADQRLPTKKRPTPSTLYTVRKSSAANVCSLQMALL